MPTQDDDFAVRPDWLLQHLVSLVNDTPLEIGVTLHASGLLVSGRLVSGADYFEGIASDFEHGLAAHPQLAESLRQRFKSFSDIYKPDQGAGTVGPAPNFIHLRDAQFFTSNGEPIPQQQGLWWRGRLSEVAGFTLGRLRTA